MASSISTSMNCGWRFEPEADKSDAEGSYTRAIIRKGLLAIDHSYVHRAPAPGNLLILLYLMQDGGSLPHRDEAFDATTFLDALEHVTHPQENPKKGIRSLHNGGFELLTTDDFGCLIATIAGMTYRMRRDRIRYPMEWAFSRHNCCYFVETIPRLFLSRDLEIRNMLGHRGFPLGVCLIATIEAQVHGQADWPADIAAWERFLGSTAGA